MNPIPIESSASNSVHASTLIFKKFISVHLLPIKHRRRNYGRLHHTTTSTLATSLLLLFSFHHRFQPSLCRCLRRRNFSSLLSPHPFHSSKFLHFIFLNLTCPTRSRFHFGLYVGCGAIFSDDPRPPSRVSREIETASRGGFRFSGGWCVYLHDGSWQGAADERGKLGIISDGLRLSSWEDLRLYLRRRRRRSSLDIGCRFARKTTSWRGIPRRFLHLLIMSFGILIQTRLG